MTSSKLIAREEGGLKPVSEDDNLGMTKAGRDWLALMWKIVYLKMTLEGK